MTELGLNATIEALIDEANRQNRGIFTGRYIVTYKIGGRPKVESILTRDPNLRVTDAGTFGRSEVNFSQLGDAASLILPEINVTIVSPAVGVEVLSMLRSDDSIESVDPETFVFAASENWRYYLRGFAAATERIRQDLLVDGLPSKLPVDFRRESEVANITWGLVATRVNESQFSGRNIKVAVLDTGVDQQHPDFIDRNIVSASFIPGQDVQDRHGHGTHCTGTACGPRSPAGVPRYGIAYGSEIYIGKVLSNSGASVDGSVLAGMNWAIANRCEVISMSLGGPGGPYPAYTNAGQRALGIGGLVVAAAGNDSRRPNLVAPAGHPANSPTILSVAAVDERLNVAVFSNGGKVDIAGSGVNVFSTWPMPRRYNTISGTSMATPHVAGIAALAAESSPGLRGVALRDALLASCRPLPLPPTDVGAGLVQAL